MATVNELTLPVDVPVPFSMTSTQLDNISYGPMRPEMIYVMSDMQAVLNAC